MSPNSSLHINSDEQQGAGCMPIVIALGVVLLLLIILAIALFWRSAWWEESGAPIPRGTERILPDLPSAPDRARVLV